MSILRATLDRLRAFRDFMFKHPIQTLLTIPGIIILFFATIFTFPGLASLFGDARYKQADKDYTNLQADIVHLSQGWKEDYRRRYYFTSQGSHIIPMDMALALEGPNTQRLLFGPNGMATTDFGYLAYPSTDGQDGPDINPFGLPIGFTMDGYIEKDFEGSHKNETMMLGMTCAACHTSDMQISGRTVRIEGNQALGDFMGFFTAMDQALAETLVDDTKFNRFAARQARIIADHPDMIESDAPLRARLKSVARQREDWQARNTPDTEGGHGRVDAFGVIFNQVVGRDIHMDRKGDLGNVRTPNAPVSYPVLWDTPHMARVQWNGIGNNVQAGGVLGRNFGQVLGVFGRTEVVSEAMSAGFCNTVKRRNLNAIDYWIRSLNAPQWTDEALEGLLPPLDTTKVEAGSKIYAENCVSCHAIVDPDFRNIAPDKKTSCDVPITVMAAPMTGTDLETANTGIRLGAQSGLLEGQKSRARRGEQMSPEEPHANILREVVARSIAGSFRTLTCNGQYGFSDLVEATAAFGMMARSSAGQDTKLQADGFDYKPAAEASYEGARDPDSECDAEATRYLYPENSDEYVVDSYHPYSYRARPLNGIWASAPYLHNGSVPTLADMLLPPEQRPTSFQVGSNKFDPIKVGFTQENNDLHFTFDTSLTGNSNVGHLWGTSLSEDQKDDLIEYLKSL